MTWNPFAWPFRAQFALGALACLGLLAYALFEQFQMGVEPCPKCIFQRVAFIAMGLVFIAGAVHAPRAVGRRVYALLVALAAVIGSVVAVRHLIVQFSPKDPLMAGCGPGLNYLLDAFPVAEAIKKAFMATGDCGEISWTFLGLTMPAWSLIWFVLLGGGALWAGFRARTQA
ncbi:MAG: disulfide bond formation protein B [Rhodanobacteraceae bacterium]|jgi:disulfide bond formation protein DsbB|nr:disulfide bond formation protein B [Rhodanobacteraceae bacterium]